MTDSQWDSHFSEFTEYFRNKTVSSEDIAALAFAVTVSWEAKHGRSMYSLDGVEDDEVMREIESEALERNMAMLRAALLRFPAACVPCGGCRFLISHESEGK